MKKSKIPSLVSIAILTIITIFFWVIFGVIRIFLAPKEISVEKEIVLPLSPTLNEDVLNSLGTKVYFTESEIGQTQIVLEEPSPSPEASPSSSPTTSPSPIPESGGSEATGSASL